MTGGCSSTLKISPCSSRPTRACITAVDDVSFHVAPGEVLGLVGESGSGKSVTAKSLMKLNASNAVYSPTAGSL